VLSYLKREFLHPAYTAALSYTTHRWMMNPISHKSGVAGVAGFVLHLAEMVNDQQAASQSSFEASIQEFGAMALSNLRLQAQPRIAAYRP